LDFWGIKGKNIIVPYYICSDVVSAIEYSGNSVIYCDIDIEDMNISFNSVHDICKKNKISVVLAPSLYGNSANLSKLSSFCKSKKIKLLNDSAQSCGATLHNKSLLMYGDAAFISVSIGKPLSGFAGAYMSIKGKKLNQKDFTNTSNIYYLLIT
jgi:dTDP-4-amino-4,6-dideoxygalactose transaminase